MLITYLPWNVLQDKTFGMKNKKGGKAQKQIEVLQRNVSAAADARREQQQKLREQQERDRKMLGMWCVDTVYFCH